MTCSMQKLPPEAQKSAFSQKLLYKYTLHELDDPLFSQIPSLQKFNSVVMQPEFADELEKIRNYEVYPDDTWVITYPKSGTTWMQETVWQIMNDGDFDNKGKKIIDKRFPFLELGSIWPEIASTRLEDVQKMKRPRFIKSHLPIAFLPTELWVVKPKIVYVTREVKDTAISYHHHCKHIMRFLGTKDEFLELFLQGNVLYGNYWDYVEQIHIVSKEFSNIKVIEYEEMKENLRNVLQSLCEFLDKKLSDETMSKLEQHLQFSSMKSNPAINFDPKEKFANIQPNDNDNVLEDFTFIRRGEIGAYKDEMPPEFIERFDGVKNTEKD